MSEIQKVESHACFGGRQEVWSHASTSTGTPMKLGVFLPPAALRGEACPVVIWLSGLTCTEQNFITKAGAQRAAAKLGLIVAAPDTSPRGDGVPDDAAYDLGQGAGFYVNATQAPWSTHFRMEDHVALELPALLRNHAPCAPGRMGLSGHSMGGHGALTLGLRHPQVFGSLSAFAPIVAPSQVPWGRKALTAYLGDDPAAWRQHDAVALIESRHDAERLPLLVHQGEADEFLPQLRPELLEQACKQAGQPLTLVRCPGYDHSYHFIASFIDEHLAHHAAMLRG